MNKKLVGLFVLICVLIGASRKYNLFSMDESDKQKVKEYHERLKAAQEDPKAQEELRKNLEKTPDLVRRSIKQQGKCPLSENFINFLLGGGPITLRGHAEQVFSVAFSPDGSKWVTGSLDEPAKLWDVNTGQLLHTFGEHTDIVRSVAFSPDGSKLATGSINNTATAKLWDVKTGQLLHTFVEHTGSVRSVAFSPDGSKLATGSIDNTAKLWDVKTGQLLHTFAGHPYAVWSVAFSSDGSKLATGSGDKTAKLWDVKTGQPIHTLTGHVSSVDSVAFSSDGSKLATGSGDETAKLWDVKTGQPIHTLTGHVSSVDSVAFSPDGSKIATGSLDHTAKLWDVNTGQQLYTFAGHTSWVLSVAFSPDGSKLATGSRDGTARIWDMKRLNKIIQLRKEEIKEKGKNLTKEPTISLQRFFKILPDKECEEDPDYCNIMSVEQCELLQAFEDTFQIEEPGWFGWLIGNKKRPVGRIQATSAQWQTFKTLPDVLQEILRNRIKAPRKYKKWKVRKEIKF